MVPAGGVAGLDQACFDCGGGLCLALMPGNIEPEIKVHHLFGTNRGLGVSSAAFHFAFLCDSLETVRARRLALISLWGLVLRLAIDLHPHRIYSFDDPNIGQRLTSTI